MEQHCFHHRYEMSKRQRGISVLHLQEIKQKIRDERNPDLRHHRVLAVSIKPFYFEVLFDHFEK